MPTDGRVDIILGLKDRFSRGVGRAQRKVTGFGRHVDTVMRGAGRGVQFLSNQINGMGTVAALLGTGAIGRGLVEFDSKLRTIANTAQITDGRMEELKRQLLGLSGSATGKTADELVDGLSQLVEAGMDLDTAVDLIGQVGRVATATQTPLEDLAKTAFFLNRSLNVPPEEMEQALGALAVVANQGSFSLNMMAQYLPEVAAGMRAIGMEGQTAVAVSAAALQMGILAKGDPAKAATSTLAFMNALVPRAKKLKKELGVDVFAGVDENGVRQWRDFSDILHDIAQASGGDVVALQKVFTEKEALTWISTAIAELETYDQLLQDAQNSEGFVAGGFERHMESTKEQLRAVRAEAEKFLQMGTGGLLDNFTRLLRVLNEHPVAIRAITAALLGMTAAAGVQKLVTVFGGLAGAMRGAPAGGGGLAAAARAATGTPVFVTNWPAAMGGPGGALAGGAGAGAGVPRAGGGRRAAAAWYAPTVGRGGRRASGAETAMAAYGAWETGTGIGAAIEKHALRGTGGGALIQQVMAKWMSLIAPKSQANYAQIGQMEGAGWWERFGDAMTNTWSLPMMLLAPKKLGGVTDYETGVADEASEKAHVNLSMTMLVMDDRYELVDVEGVDDVEFQAVRY